MSAQGDCEFLVQRARELVPQDLWAAKAWLITARSLYPADFNIQYEMYTIERNAERTATAGRLLYDMFVNFPDQPVVWREISIITSALRNDSQDKQTQFLRSLFETLPGRVQCEMLLKVTEQCFNTLERSEMLLLLLRRFPETVVQHGVGLGEALLEAETIEEQDSPVNCFRKLFVCDVLPLIINNHDVRLPANLLYKYLNKAAEFYINYVTRSTQLENQHQGAQDTSDLMSPSKRSSQKYVIEGLTEKSSQIVDPWERLFKILNVVGMRCEWQMDKGRRGCSEILHRMKELCRYMSSFDSEAHANYKNQVLYSTVLVFFKSAFQYVSSIQPSLFQGPNAPSQVPLVLLEDVANVYGDIEIDRSKHIHKKRKLAEGREKTMQSSDDEECSAKGRNRHIVVSKAELSNSIEVLESFKLARESWELLYSQEFFDKEFTRICLAWKTDTWLWLRIFLTDMIIYQGQYKKAIASLHHLAALQGSLSQPQITGQGTLEHQRALIQLATCHFALGEYRMTCEKVLDLMCYMVLPIQDGVKSQEEPSKVKPKFRKGLDLKLLPCTSKAIMPYCLHLMLACFKLRAFTDNRDDMALGHVIVLLQQEWPRGENLFLKAISKICQQGNFQYENFFSYVTNIDMLEEFAYLRTQEGGKIHLELLPNQGMLIKHHTVTRGITKGVKEDFRLAMERQVSRCGENLMVVLHRFCINEKILLLQTLT
ncbi:integrator complex subunit 10 isoform X7 [Meriones unguiculatus]|uniref:integrator complex subunit 10 isoform X7 n=1 Tax=Meriones unguiculatus TaxID=10047 RepID=UPI000B4F8E5C|nr:integrator complex subunit 10 isoform X7 [Meriones unguiculatus]XP_021519820.1 integrator complex subunit 10 isoform X7 [Meriones unguiculatus]